MCEKDKQRLKENQRNYRQNKKFLQCFLNI